METEGRGRDSRHWGPEIFIYILLKTGLAKGNRWGTMDIWTEYVYMPETPSKWGSTSTIVKHDGDLGADIRSSYWTVVWKILQSIGNFIGVFLKTDPLNVNCGWKLYVRIRVKMDVKKPLKRRMKIKREGGAWQWINFQYKRVSTFCFMCGVMGHEERDCDVVYGNPDRTVEREYGSWLRAPLRNNRNQNLGARWLWNRAEGEQAWTWQQGGMSSSTDHDEHVVAARFMEVDGYVREISGGEGAIPVNQRD